MKRSLVVILLATTVASAGIAVIGSIGTRVHAGPRHALHAKRVVLFTMPAVTWSDIDEANVPTIDRLVREGATAALAPRSASLHPSSARGYITLGAGNRGAAPSDGSAAQLAYEPFEKVTPRTVRAIDVFAAETGIREHVDDGVVHLGVPELQTRQESQYHGAVVGALGEALARAHIERGIVSAADRATDAVPPETGRGEAVLSIVDGSGIVPHGRIRDLLIEGRPSAYGVQTEPSAFETEVRSMLKDVRVLVVDPGETQRADDFADKAIPVQATRLRRAALQRTDRILASVVKDLRSSDLLLVVGPASSSQDPQEHLTPIVAWGAGVKPGELTSATTHSPGAVTLTDVAPTVLSIFGITAPPSMSGRPIRQVDSSRARPLAHDELDKRSVFREGFVPAVFYSFVALFVVLLLLVALVFLFHLPFEVPLTGICYLILAVPLATFVLSVVPLWRLGALPAHIVLWTVSVAIAVAASRAPGSRWMGAMPMLLATAVFITVVLVCGGQLMSNAVFGNSVLAAGRFYGIPNTGSALFFGATVLALCGLGELWPPARTRTAMAIVLVALLVLTGAPGFGADVGGLLAGVAAVAVILLVARGGRIPWRLLVGAGLAAVALTFFVAYLDSLRAADSQTHLGRFVSELFTSDGTALITIKRKAAQALASLSFSRFTYVIPLALAALVVLVRRPNGPLREILATHRLLRAGMAGLVVGGILGFALNDSGVAVPALLLGQAVPLIVLLGVDHARDARTRTSQA